MNFVFISPHFPHTYWQFCQRLSQNGVTVLAIADVHYDLLQPELLRQLGRRTVKAFGVVSRFVHLEFFRLDSERPGLSNIGDFVALEVNMRPAGGYTPDMINYAHSTDVYKVWADMVAFDELRTEEGKPYYCAFASRRDIYRYRHSHNEVKNRYSGQLMMCERMPELFSAAMGQQMYTVRLNTMDEVQEFINYVHAKQ